MEDRVAGIDAYGRGAWVAVVLHDGQFARALVGRSLVLLMPLLADASVIAIDIPIGLPGGSTPRRADLLARARLKGRASTVFRTPPRAVLETPEFKEANQIAIDLTGKGVSLQSHGMRKRILEVEPYARADQRIVEVIQRCRLPL